MVRPTPMELYILAVSVLDSFNRRCVAEVETKVEVVRAILFWGSDFISAIQTLKRT